MQKIIVFTDIHLMEPGERIIGLDPSERFRRGLEHALMAHSDAERVVITGDLTHHGRPAQYDRLKAVLRNCPLPVSLMLGNHDRRDAFREAFPESPVTARGFVQEVVDIGDMRLVMLDTLDEDAPDVHSGFLCAHRLDWLDRALDGAGERRVVVFTHHPPMLTGFGGMDGIGLRNRAELLHRLGAHPNVVQIVSGHIHRTISGGAGGIPVAVFKSTCHQMPMDLGSADPRLSVDEPGAYGLLLMGEEGVIVLSEDFTLPRARAAVYD